MLIQTSKHLDKSMIQCSVMHCKRDLYTLPSLGHMCHEKGLDNRTSDSNRCKINGQSRKIGWWDYAFCPRVCHIWDKLSDKIKRRNKFFVGTVQQHTWRGSSSIISTSSGCLYESSEYD